MPTSRLVPLGLEEIAARMLPEATTHGFTELGDSPIYRAILASATKWARQDSNLGPRDYESPALTAELQARRAATREHRIFNVQRPIFTARTGWRARAANWFVDYLDVRQRCG